MQEDLNELEALLNKIISIASVESPKRAKLDLKSFSNTFDHALYLENENNNNNELNKSEIIKEYESKISYLKEQISMYKKNEKMLRNQLLDLKGSIRVACRIKPSSNRNNIFVSDNKINVENKEFQLDKVFDCFITQNDIFMHFKESINSVLDGYNMCVFAYGQTGSGKTHTMHGEPNNAGLIKHSLDELSRCTENLKAEGFIINNKIKYLEIYNEAIYDLLNSNGIVTLIHDNDGVRLKGSKEISLENLNKAEEIIDKANNLRKKGETACNKNSSRSHSIFILEIEALSESEERRGALILIDLAGSERLSESQAENERLKETQHINKSLSVLGNVFSSLKRGEKHVPYRDSKLTHFLQKYLSGNSRMSMIVNINPENTNETICSLRFAAKVSECNLGPTFKNTKKIF